MMDTIEIKPVVAEDYVTARSTIQFLRSQRYGLAVIVTQSYYLIRDFDRVIETASYGPPWSTGRLAVVTIGNDYYPLPGQETRRKLREGLKNFYDMMQRQSAKRDSEDPGTDDEWSNLEYLMDRVYIEADAVDEGVRSAEGKDAGLGAALRDQTRTVANKVGKIVEQAPELLAQGAGAIADGAKVIGEGLVTLGEVGIGIFLVWAAVQIWGRR